MGHPHDYPYIRAWGRLMSSNWSYVQDQIAHARVDRAPKDAIYKREQSWARWSDIKDGAVKTSIAEVVEREARGE